MEPFFVGTEHYHGADALRTSPDWLRECDEQLPVARMRGENRREYGYWLSYKHLPGFLSTMQSVIETPVHPIFKTLEGPIEGEFIENFEINWKNCRKAAEACLRDYGVSYVRCATPDEIERSPSGPLAIT